MTDAGFATLDDIDAFYAYNLDIEVEKDIQQFMWENNINVTVDCDSLFGDDE